MSAIQVLIRLCAKSDAKKENIVVCNIVLLISTVLMGADKDLRPDLKGVVAGPDHKSLSGATVCIHTARERSGSQTRCPSCYADCVKHATTGADGSFAIPSVQPGLVFQLLVVAEGYEPALIDKADPLQAPLRVELNRVNPARLGPGHFIRGRVSDPEGTPLRGARASTFGCKDGKTRWWGPLPGVDPLAVTNLQGEFLITSEKADVALDFRVEAAGFAPKLFALLPTTKEIQELHLAHGVTIRGRLIQNSSPLVGAVMYAVQVKESRTPERSLGPKQTVTDSAGRFTFWNVGANEEYFLCGTMEDAVRWGTTPLVSSFRVGADATEFDAGVLRLQPVYQVAGQIVLTDGKPLPAGTRVSLTRDDAWDLAAVEVDSRGRFAFTGVPAEKVYLSVPLRGYRLARSNESLDPLRPWELVGRVQKDVLDLHVALEPGNATSLDLDALPAGKSIEMIKHLRKLEDSPLRGAPGTNQ